MKIFASLGRALVLSSLLVGAAAQADPFTSSLVATDPTQFGRLSRNGQIQQDWVGSEPFPGVINTTSLYHYHLYYFNVGLTPFIDIIVDSTSTTTFFSAYQTVYNPANLSQAWLGDAASSGNFFGTDPRYFDVVAGLNTTLIVAVNETTTNGGLAMPYTLQVTGFSAPDFVSNATDLNPVAVVSRIPEPSTMLLLGFAPLALVARRRAKKSQSNDTALAIAA